MAHPLLLACAAALLIHASNAATIQQNMGGGMQQSMTMSQTSSFSFTINHSLFMTYTSSSQRDQLLQQVFGLWKQVLGSVQASGLKIQFNSEAPGLGANSHIVKYTVTGTAPSKFDVKGMTTQFASQLSSAGISGVSTSASTTTTTNMNGGGMMNGGSNGQMSGNMGGGVTMSWTLEIQTTLSYTNQAGRDKITQQILALFKKTFASYNFQNIKIAVTSETPSQMGGNDKDVTLQITGTGSGDVDINSLTTTLVSALSTTTIQGVDSVSGGGDSNGGGSMNGGMSGSGSMTGDMTGDGSGSSSSQDMQLGFNQQSKGQTQPFQMQNQVTITTSNSKDINNILQQILKLWTTTYGSKYGLTNVKISMVSQTQNDQGGFDVTYQITGSSKQSSNFNVQTITSDFQNTLSGSGIANIVVSGGGNGGSDNSDSGSNSGSMSGSMSGQWSSNMNGGGSGNNNGGGSGSKQLNLVNTVTITSSNKNDINNIIQQILSTFTTTYGSQYGITKPNIKITSQKSNGNGGWTVTYTITGTATQTVNSQDLSNQFHDVLRDQGITNLDVSTVSFVVSGGGSMTNNMNGNMNGGGDDNSNNNNGGSGSGSQQFNIQNTVVVTFKNDADLNNILNQILTLWKTTYSSQYQPSGAKITIVSKKQVSGKWQITYKITGTSTQNIDSDQNNQDFVNTLQSSTISGVTGFVINGQVTNIQGGGGNGGNSNNNNGNNNNGGSGSGQFNIQNTVVLNYKSDSDLNNILQQILTLWKTTYTSQYQPSGAKITIVSKKQVSGKWQVTYKITGTSSQTIDSDQNDQDFSNTLQSSSISGLIGFVINGQVTNIGGGGSGGDMGNTDNKNNNNGGGGSGSNSFTFDDSLFITWTSTSQRDQLLQQILNSFKQTFAQQYTLTNLKIVFVSGSSGKSVSYRITGLDGSGSFDTQSAKDTFHGAIGTSIKGVSVTGSGSGSGSGSGMPVDFTDIVWLTYGSNSERDQLLQTVLTLWQQVLSTFQITGWKIVSVSSSAVSGQSGTFEVKYRITGKQSGTQGFNVLDQIEIFRQQLTAAAYPNIQVPGSAGGNSDSGSGSSSVQQTGPGDFSFTGTIYLAYRTKAERDVFLPQLQVIWTNTINDYVPSNVKLTFISEKNNVATLSKAKGGAPVSQVTYKLTGQVQTAFVYNDVVQTFMQTVKDAHLGRVITDLKTDL